MLMMSLMIVSLTRLIRAVSLTDTVRYRVLRSKLEIRVVPRFARNPLGRRGSIVCSTVLKCRPFYHREALRMISTGNLTMGLNNYATEGRIYKLVQSPIVKGGYTLVHTQRRSSFAWQDTGEFSAAESEDSGFEESTSPNDRKKEQNLKNDKYDMALEVGAEHHITAQEGTCHCVLVQCSLRRLWRL